MKFLKRLLGLGGKKNKQEKDSFTCEKCDKDFETEAELKIHKHKHKNEMKGKKKAKEESKDTTKGSEEKQEKDEQGGDDLNYDEVVTHTIKEVKATVEGEDVDYKKLLEAEKANKDRKTMKSWIEDQMD